LDSRPRFKYEAKERNEKTRVRQESDVYSGYDLCQNCYHKREIHLGVCMLEKDNQFPCDCIEFKEKKDKRISLKK